jgi:hypothetical protein
MMYAKKLIWSQAHRSRTPVMRIAEQVAFSLRWKSGSNEDSCVIVPNHDVVLPSLRKPASHYRLRRRVY